MAEIQPPELAALVDFAERPRAGGWSLRAALTRYAQGQPRRVSELLDLVRRIQAALGTEDVAGTGAELWRDLEAGVDEGLVLGLLHAARAIDEVGDLLAVWADDPWNAHRPDGDLDAVLASVSARLDALGVAREEARPPRGRRRG